MVVEVVGARPIGQASAAAGSVSATSAAAASVDPARAVIATSGRPKRRECATRSASSAVSPEFDSASTASPGTIMPRSPCEASAGWTNRAAVPWRPAWRRSCGRRGRTCPCRRPPRGRWRAPADRPRRPKLAARPAASAWSPAASVCSTERATSRSPGFGRDQRPSPLLTGGSREGQPGASRPDKNRAKFTDCGRVSAQKYQAARNPSRSSRARAGRKPKHASASSRRPSRTSRASSFAHSAWRCSTSEAA